MSARTQQAALKGLPKRIQRRAVRFLRYQRRWIADRSKFKQMVKSRRVGGSEAAAYSGACKAVGYDPCTGVLDVTKGAEVNILSASHAQSRVMLARAIETIREMEKLPEDVDRAISIAKRHRLPLTVEVIVAICDELRGTRPNAGYIVSKTRKKHQAQALDGLIQGDPNLNECLLTNGAIIKAYAANPNTFRGIQGHVIADEWGVMPHQQEMWAAMEAVSRGHLGLPQGYTLEVLGTPCGDDNMHYDFAMTKAGAQFSRHKIDIYTAVNDGFPLDPDWPENPNGGGYDRSKVTPEMIKIAIDRLKAECGLIEIFEQEYNCAFLSASTRYIPIQLIDEAIYYSKEQLGDVLLKNRDTRTITAGHDVARAEGQSADPCAHVRNHRLGDPEQPGRKFDGLYWMDIDVKSSRGVKFEDQEAWIDQSLYNCPQGCRLHADGYHTQGAWRVAIDRTGMGMDLAERLVKKHSARILPVDFTRASKEMMATRFKFLLEKHMQRIPDNIELRRGIMNLHRYLTKDGGSARYDVKKTPEGGHGDVLWALMLAQHAAEAPGSVPTHQQGWWSRG